ncbi:MAG TPA: hypothetical protein GXZ56_10070 [Bacteroidales bacterium]|jgi:xylulokinase|nr:hypothetical protein [Bacteroidales bacterium]
MNCFLGIDLGTSYFKAGIFDENGSLLGLGRHAVGKRFPVFREEKASPATRDAVGCELPVAVFWDTLQCCVSGAVRHAGISPREVSALSYSSQANSFILLDEADHPLTPFILWPDERAVEDSDTLGAFSSRAGFLEKTGLGVPPDRQSMIAKIEWFQEKKPSLWEKVKSIMTISDYLAFILTGERVSDVSTASMTGLLDVPANRWWPDATECYRVQREQLSTPLRTGSRVGNLTAKGAKLIGLSAGTLLFSGGLDHHMVAIGAGIPKMNGLSESTGTVLACVRYRQGYAPRTGVNTAPGLEENYFFEMAFDDNGAVALEWYRENHARGKTFEELLQEARTVPIGCDGLFARPRANRFKALQGFDPVQKGHREGHFVRAILESTAASLLELVTTLDKERQAGTIVPSGGGAKSSLWLQIKANLLNRPFWVPASGELACKGAALSCTVGLSLYGSFDEAMEKQTSFCKRVFPRPVEVEKYKEWYLSYRAKTNSTLREGHADYN